jgi:hypothetical protein
MIYLLQVLQAGDNALLTHCYNPGLGRRPREYRSDERLYLLLEEV